MPDDLSRPKRARLIGILALVFVFFAALAGTAFWLIRSYLQTPQNAIVLNEPPPPPAAAPVRSANKPAAIPGVPIGGVVHNEQGQAVGKVQINFNWHYDASDANGKIGPVYHSGHAVTDDQGRWTFASVPKEALASLSLEFKNKDYVTLSMDASPIDPLLAANADYQLTRGLDLSGQVVDEAGNPISGAIVTNGESLNDKSLPSATSDAGGHFVIHHVAIARQSLLVSLGGFAPAAVQIVAADLAKPAIVTLLPGQTVRGQIVDEAGKPVAGASAYMNFWDRYDVHRSATSDSQGRFVMKDLPKASLRFTFSKTGYQSPDKYIVPGEEAVVIKLLRVAIVSGTVVDAVTQKPIPKFDIISGALWPGWRSPIFGFSRGDHGIDGKFKIRPHGFSGEVLGWYVRVEADGYLPAVSSPVVSGDATANFQLQPSPDISVQVVDADGKPVAGAKMMMVTPSCAVYVGQSIPEQSDMAAQMGKTDANGGFNFHPQIAPFEIWAFADGGCARLTELSYDGSPLKMAIAPWATVRLHEPASTTPPTEQISLQLTDASDPANTLNFSHWNYVAKPDEKGVAEFKRVRANSPDNLAIAEWYLPGGGLQDGGRTGVVQLKAGEVTDVDFTGGVTVSGRFVPQTPADKVDHPLGRLEIQAIPDGPPSQWPTDWLAAARLAPKVFNYFTYLDKSGQFRIAGMAPGRYEYALTIESGSGPICGAGILNVPDGVSELSAPDIQYAKFTKLKVGDAAPEIFGRTLEDKPIRAADYAGKCVVWMVYDTGSAGCEGDSPALVAMAQKLGADPHVALVAVNAERATSSYSCPPLRAPGVAQFGWTDGYTSLVDQRLFLSSFDYQDRAPAIFIVDPAGKIAAVHLAAEEVEGKVGEIEGTPAAIRN